MEYDLPDITEPIGPGGTQEPTVNRKVIAIAKLTDVDSARQGLYKYFEWTVSTVHHNLLTDNKLVEERGIMVWAPTDAEGDSSEDWFRGTGDHERWPSSAALTGMRLMDGQLVAMRDNADDSVEDILAYPDPAITNFIVGADCRSHHMVVEIFNFLRTYDREGDEIGQALSIM